MLGKTFLGGIVFSMFMAGAASALELGTIQTRVLKGLEGPSTPRMISSAVTGATPLASEGLDSLKGRDLRARYWVIMPDGIVPIHEHAARPATIFTLQGNILEYRNDRDEPVLHSSGDISLEEGAELVHWWHNAGGKGVRLIAFDVVITSKDFDTVEVAAVPEGPEMFDFPEPSGVERELAGFVDLGAHFDGAFGEGLALTHYRATVEPGGTLPLWTRPGEPAIMFVEEGEIEEHRSDQAKASTITREKGSVIANGVAVWWRNSGKEAAKLHIGAIEPLAITEGTSNSNHAN